MTSANFLVSPSSFAPAASQIRQLIYRGYTVNRPVRPTAVPAIAATQNPVDTQTLIYRGYTITVPRLQTQATHPARAINWRYAA